MEGGGDWVNPDKSPVHGIRFLLDFGSGTLHEIAIDQGHLINLDETKGTSSKRDFLLNFRVARNLFVHPQKVEADSAAIGTGAVSATLSDART